MRYFWLFLSISQAGLSRSRVSFSWNPTKLKEKQLHSWRSGRSRFSVLNTLRISVYSVYLCMYVSFTLLSSFPYTEEMNMAADIFLPLQDIALLAYSPQVPVKGFTGLAASISGPITNGRDRLGDVISSTWVRSPLPEPSNCGKGAIGMNEYCKRRQSISRRTGDSSGKILNRNPPECLNIPSIYFEIYPPYTLTKIYFSCLFHCPRKSSSKLPVTSY